MHKAKSSCKSHKRNSAGTNHFVLVSTHTIFDQLVILIQSIHHLTEEIGGNEKCAIPNPMAIGSLQQL
uniref:Uncharacterized protein n=1 Tax=Rhizophora mucronata TaxID=61149 RepID=A0A2P2KAY5_RHIMU